LKERRNKPVLAYPDFCQLFILSTDASKVAVAATLSLVHDGMQRPIAYASRQMNKAEQAYAASDAEMLAVVLAVKYFRCYLFSRKFVVRTNHSEFKEIRGPEDQAYEMEFKAGRTRFHEHRSGKKIPHVEALLRHVGTILKDGSLSPEDFLQEQGKDKYCQSLKLGN